MKTLHASFSVSGLGTLLCATGMILPVLSFADAPVTPKKPKALVIMLDGMRADAIENAHAPNLRMLRDGKWQAGYKCAWSLGAHTIYDAVTVSGPNHTAIATGVTAKKHTIMQNRKSTCDFKKWPSWLVRVADAKPGTKGLFMFSWRWDNQISPDPRVEFIHGSDAGNAEAMAKRLAAADAPDAVQWYIDWPDHGGHGFGYYPYTTGYFNTVYLSDKAIGAALKAIASRPTFKDEDWMIIVTADHGGYWRTHGLWGGHCETIPFLVAGRNVSQGRIPGIPQNYYAAPTVLAHFGIDSSGFNLDGKIVGSETVAETKRSLKEGLAVYLPFEGKQIENKVATGPKPEICGTNTTLQAKGGFIGNCLHMDGSTNTLSGVCLKGSEKLAFENGSGFAMSMWVRMPEEQKNDPVIVANKDWNKGSNPGILLTGNKKIQSKVGGVCFNAGMGGPRSRIDVGPYDIEFGKWTFYAVTLGADGVLDFYQGGRDGHLYRIAFNASTIKTKTGLPFRLGQDGTGKYPAAFKGDIDDFVLWTRPISHEDVRRIYKAGIEGIPFEDLL
ncbi:MAG: alkaline phosphatase family protein [Kiritimatiellae bacterium]|nr:alkaline phosphatase family protein [Kiritimatiellia bacterium]